MHAHGIKHIKLETAVLTREIGGYTTIEDNLTLGHSTGNRSKSEKKHEADCIYNATTMNSACKIQDTQHIHAKQEAAEQR